MPRCAVRVLRSTRLGEYLELVALFFVQGAALGMWLVPLSTVLEAHGLDQIRPYAFATTAIAAFISPLIFGAMADRHASPVKVLRGLSLATALAMALASAAIRLEAAPWIVLALIQLHALCSSPTWSISSSIVFARLRDARKEFGPIRAMATLGWMAGCWAVSLLNADTSTLAGFSGAVTWLVVFGLTFLLPRVEAPKSAVRPSWHERLGLDALRLLKIRDHRVVFLTTLLFSIPLAAFYPYAPPHLRELGLRNTSAWMSLGQVPEIIAMFALGALFVRWRLKWIFAFGLTFGVARFAFSALDTQTWLLLGVLLHGASFTFVYITAQIYLDQRVDSAWRTRAQALLSVVNGGLGNLLGYLGTGWWFSAATGEQGVQWPLFWGGLAGLALLILIFFLVAYRGRGVRPGLDEGPEPGTDREAGRREAPSSS
jgi:nucleoside transporter